MVKNESKIFDLLNKNGFIINNENIKSDISIKSLIPDIIQWLADEKRILVTVDYNYEFTSTSYFYKIYKFTDEHGKPEKQPIYGARYNSENNETLEIVGYRDYRISYKDYPSYIIAMEEGILEVLNNLESKEKNEN